MIQYFHSRLLKEKHIPENPLVLVFGSYGKMSTLFFQVDKSWLFAKVREGKYIKYYHYRYDDFTQSGY